MTTFSTTHGDALLIVDVQRDFLPGGALGVPEGDEVVPLLSTLAEAFAAKKLIVVASRDWHPANHCSFRQSGGPWPPHCRAGTPGAELDPGLNMSPGTIIVDKGTTTDKDTYSAFEGTALDATLQQAGIKRLFIGGLATEYCVLNTATDALQHGYDVILLQDAIRAIDPEAGRRAIAELRELGAEVIDSDEVRND
jgi:nicotinamidase/pyrazinamidase